MTACDHVCFIALHSDERLFVKNKPLANYRRLTDISKSPGTIIPAKAKVPCITVKPEKSLPLFPAMRFDQRQNLAAETLTDTLSGYGE